MRGSDRGDASIGVFDSGVGGISVANAIQARLPNESLIYLADCANAPYGNKNAEFVLSRAQFITRFLLDKGCKLIVVACNSATLSCIETLRRQFFVPFVGVEPGVKPAILASKSGRVGVMATARTIDSEQYAALLKRVSGDAKVFNQPCHGLADQIEKGEFDSTQTMDLIRQYVGKLLDHEVDQIALGCTHYGFVAQQIKTVVQNRAQIIDTSAAIAKQVEVLLLRDAMASGRSIGVSHTIKVNGLTEALYSTIDNLWLGAERQISAL